MLLKIYRYSVNFVLYLCSMFILYLLICLSVMAKTKSVTIDELRLILDEKLDQKLMPLNVKITDLNNRIEESMKFLELANAKYDEVIEKFAIYDHQNKEIIAENKILKSSLQNAETQVHQLKEAYNQVEQYSRRDCIQIQGIPLQRLENTNEIVKNIGKLIHFDIDDADISISHRLPSKNGRESQNVTPIIVKFVRRHTKEIFYRARKNLRNVTTMDLGYTIDNKIYVTESLTEKNKQLFREFLNVKKMKKYKFIWTINGRIYMRKNENADSQPILIKSREDLNRLPR